jgi:hypothetical protein
MIIETVTAVYHLEEEVLYRFPREESENPVDHDVAELRRDALPIPYRLLKVPVVGEPMQFLLLIREDGVPTVRTTTPVTSIDGRDE